jgi:adenylate kinase
MQQYAGIYLLQNHSTYLGCPSHPSSGVHKTVTAVSGTGHSIWVTTFLQRDLKVTRIIPCIKEMMMMIIIIKIKENQGLVPHRDTLRVHYKNQPDISV